MIQFFISSTFQDMVGEREALHSKILPKVNDAAKKYGEYVECVDLRWGLDTEHKAEIIKVCLAQIKNPCHFNMIIFLGNRYGTIPGKNNEINLIERQWKEVSEETLPDYNISITQLELEYGFFRYPQGREQPERICLIRKDGGPKEDIPTKQKELIERVTGEKGGNTYEIDYHAQWDDKSCRSTDLDNMINALTNQIKEILEKRSKERSIKNWVDLAELEAASFRTQLTQYFCGRKEKLAEIVQAIEDDSVHTVCVYGPSASGKSSILSKVYELNNCERKYFIACGHTMRSRTYLDVLLQMIYFIEKMLRVDKPLDDKKDQTVKVQDIYSEEKAESKFLDLVVQYNTEGTSSLLFFIDALDKLSASGNIRIQEFLNQAGKVKIICSQIEKPAEPLVKDIEIGELSKEDICQIVDGHMVVSGIHVDRIVDSLVKKREAGNPLYITSAIHILWMNLEKDLPDKKEEKNKKKHERRYLMFENLVRKFSENIEDLCWETIRYAGKYLGFPAYEKVCGMIAISENGLRSDDLRQIISDQEEEEGETKEWKFELFRAYLNKNQYFRIQENGCWTFGHDLIKEGVRKNMCEKEKMYKTEFFTYLQKLPAHDEIKIEEGLLLCAEKQEYEFAKKIFEELLELKEDKRETTLIMQTLHTIVWKKNRKAWFVRLIEKYPRLLLNVLERGLRYDSGPEYDRRYPAKELADIYWKLQKEYKNAERLIEKLDKLGEEEKLEFCAACAEYVGIYDDVSQNAETFAYELPVYKYVCQEANFQDMSDENKERVYKWVNLVFYSNNKIANGIRKGEIECDSILTYDRTEKISRGFIEWYEKNLRDAEKAFAGRGKTEGKFVNNIGQFYEAIGEYGGAYPYRVQALRVKASVLFDNIKSSDNAWKEKFECILKGTRISVMEHRNFWEGVKEKADVSKFGNLWNQIAVSYRTIATDCYYLADSATYPEKELRDALGLHELCLNMQKEEFVSRVEKEIAVTYIRKVGVYKKIYPMLSEEEKSEIIPCTQEATEWTVRFAYQDNREQEKLRDNLVELINLFKEEGKDCNELKQCYERLPKDSEGKGE